jgi:hypothetical protein
LFSAKVPLKNRTYFFNVKENRLGDIFMTVVESKPNEGEGFDRHQVVLFADDVQEFLKGFESSLRYIEKEMGDRRKAKFEGRAKPAHASPEGQERAPDKKKVLRVKDGASSAKGRDASSAKGRDDSVTKGRGAYVKRQAKTAKPGEKPGKGGFKKRPTIRALKREE